MSYLKKIGLENFRIFDTLTEFDLKKITILTGANSSGKSSLYKCLLLLANNIRRNSIYKIDFTGIKHNLGSYSDTVNKITGKKHIRIVETISEPFSFPRKYRSNRAKSSSPTFLYEDRPNQEKDLLILDLKYQESNNYGLLTSLIMSYSKDGKTVLLFKAETSYKKKGRNHKASINLFFLNEILKNSDSFLSIYKGKGLLFDIENLGDSQNFFDFEITPSDVAYPDSNKYVTRNDDILYMIHQLDIQKESIYGQYRNSKFYKKENESDVDWKNSSISLLIQSIIESSYTFYYTLDLIEAVRGKSKRIYTNDSQSNLFDDLLIDLNFVKLNTTETDFMNKWFREFGLADEIIFEKIGGGIATQVMFIKNGIKYSIADLGFGVTQLLPILLSIVLKNKKRPNARYSINGIMYNQYPHTFILEEPETNLHPKLQSRIADMIVDASNIFNLNFIIETHSEYFIRRLQILASDQVVNNDDIIIYYFYDKNEIPKYKNQVEKINVLSDGGLDNDFGPGFFDEATNMKFQLLKKRMKK